MTMSSPIIRHVSEDLGIFDKLYSVRQESFFIPNEDGSPSLNGRVVWHTEWWRFQGDVLLSKSPGPTLEDYLYNLLGRSWDMPDGTIVSAETLILGNISAFESVAHLQIHRSLIQEVTPNE